MEKPDLTRLINFVNLAKEDGEQIFINVLYKKPNRVAFFSGSSDDLDYLTDKNILYLSSRSSDNLPETLCSIELHTHTGKSYRILIGKIVSLETAIKNTLYESRLMQINLNNYWIAARGKVVKATDITNPDDYAYLDYTYGDLVFDSVQELSESWTEIKNIIHLSEQKEMERKLI